MGLEENQWADSVTSCQDFAKGQKKCGTTCNLDGSENNDHKRYFSTLMSSN